VYFEANSQWLIDHCSFVFFAVLHLNKSLSYSPYVALTHKSPTSYSDAFVGATTNTLRLPSAVSCAALASAKAFVISESVIIYHA
jgi:hypothetical protein